MILAGAISARASVTSFAATVESEVRQTLNGAPGDAEYAFDSFPSGSAANLPLIVPAKLSVTDGGGTIQSVGHAVTTFNDPRKSDVASPEEFGISAAAYSRDSTASYDVRSFATERREIVFTADELGLGDGTAVLTQSHFYVDGVILIWGDTAGMDLSAVFGKARIEVVQEKAAGSTTPLVGEIILQGTSDGRAVMSRSGGVFSNGAVRIDASGIVPGPQILQVVVIPNIVVTYPYDAVVGESFSLKASIEGTVRNAPGGRGAAVLLGLPQDELILTINRIVSEGTGDALIAQLRATGTAPGSGSVTTGDSTSETVTPSPTNVLGSGGCSLFGVETLFGAALIAGAAGFRGRRG